MLAAGKGHAQVVTPVPHERVAGTSARAQCSSQCGRASPMPTSAPGLGHRGQETRSRFVGDACPCDAHKSLGIGVACRVGGSEFTAAYAGACSAKRRLAQCADGGWRHEPLHQTAHRSAQHNHAPRGRAQHAPLQSLGSRTHAGCWLLSGRKILAGEESGPECMTDRVWEIGN
jgi:hypothetical protein